MLALFLLAAAAPQSVTVAPICPEARALVKGRQTARPRKLGEEPPARQFYTVLRTADGCTKPVPVNQRRIGNR